MKWSLWFLAALAGAQDSYLIRNATLHPVTGPEIANASLLIENGKIAALGAKLAAPKNAKVIDAKGLHVYPGMINCATQIGLSEVGSVRETNDTNEIGEFIPQVRAIVAVNPESEHIYVTRANGITGALTLPATMATAGGPGSSTAGQSIVRGQAALLRLDGWTWEDLGMVPSAGMMVRFPRHPNRHVRLPRRTHRNSLRRSQAPLRSRDAQDRRVLREGAPLSVGEEVRRPYLPAGRPTRSDAPRA